jgi:hypothetical protein
MRASAALAGASLSIMISASGCSSSNTLAPNAQRPANATTTTATISAAPITKADFVARAKAICHKQNLDIGQIPRGGDPASQSAGEEAIVGILQRTIAQLRGLGYPPGDRGTLEPIYDGALRAIASGGPGAIAPWGVQLTAYGLDCGSQ